MNYILKVESCNIDKVILSVSEYGKNITIKNILRNDGNIYIKTDLILFELREIKNIIDIKRETFIPSFLVF